MPGRSYLAMNASYGSCSMTTPDEALVDIRQQ
jgi:hypothetical protein